MKNELSNLNEHDLIQMMSNDLGSVIKPLYKEIYLFDTKVSGIGLLKDTSVLNEIKVDDKLTLVREVDNKFDPGAIKIMTKNNKKLGYIPEKDNIIFSRLMDAGKLISAKIKSIDTASTFTLIKIDIYLIDF